MKNMILNSTRINTTVSNQDLLPNLLDNILRKLDRTTLGHNLLYSRLMMKLIYLVRRLIIIST